MQMDARALRLNWWLFFLCFDLCFCVWCLVYSVQPLFNVMILTGLLGYSVEWLWVGRKSALEQLMTSVFSLF